MTLVAAHQVSSEGDYMDHCLKKEVTGYTYSEDLEKTVIFFFNLFDTRIQAFRDVMKKHEKSSEAWVNLGKLTVRSNLPKRGVPCRFKFQMMSTIFVPT
jgi:hypothetical protein